MLVRTLRRHRNQPRPFDGRPVSIKIAEMLIHPSQVKPGGLLLVPEIHLMTLGAIAVPTPSSIEAIMLRSPAFVIAIRQRHLLSS